jgi:hypothetical protein
LAIYHAALTVELDGTRYVIEVAPAWDRRSADRGVAARGPVGSRLLGRSVLFRYEVRCWRDGVIPDQEYAVASPVDLTTDADRARLLLARTTDVPTPVWGRDELRAGEMWNSNAVVSWLLTVTGHPLPVPPPGGRAPGWLAGVVVAGRGSSEPGSTLEPGVPVGLGEARK